VNSVTVTDATHATVNISVADDAAVGTRNVMFTTGGEVVTLVAGFSVTAGTPVITEIDPNSARQGQANLNVAITGRFTHWTQGQTTASFGPSITVHSLAVSDSTHATANLTVAVSAALGPRNVTLTTGDEVVTLNNGFTVTTGLPVITEISPSSGKQGQEALNVAITGRFTHWAQGQTSANFGASITILSVTVTDATHATVRITVAGDAAVGTRNVTLNTGSESVTLTGGFNVTAGLPVLTEINPNSGQRGQANLNVAIAGKFTHFVQGQTSASFGGSIEVHSVTVTDATHATVNMTIAENAELGTLNVTLTTGSEVVTLANGFTVNAASPVITTVNPNTGAQGQANLNVTFTVNSVRLVQGRTTASFGPSVTVHSLTVTDATHATARITVASDAALGARNVSLTMGRQVIPLNNGFTVTPGTPALTRVKPNTAHQGTANLNVSISGRFTHFVQGQTVANFGPMIAVNSVTVTNEMNATANITIGNSASVGPRDLTLSTGGEVVTALNGFTVTDVSPAPPHKDEIQVGYAIITPATPGKMAIFETFGLKRIGQTPASGLLPSDLTTHAVLFVRTNKLSRNMGIAIANPEGAGADVTISLRRNDGTALATKTIRLTAYQQTARFVTELFPDREDVPRNLIGTIDITSTHPIALVGLQFRGDSFSTLPVTNLSAPMPVPVVSPGVGGPGAVILPHFVAGGGWASQIVIANTGTSSMTIRMDLFKQNGTPLTTELNDQTRSSFTGLTIPAGGILILSPWDDNGDDDF
jgi:hypothetical protein